MFLRFAERPSAAGANGLRQGTHAAHARRERLGFRAQPKRVFQHACLPIHMFCCVFLCFFLGCSNQQNATFVVGSGKKEAAGKVGR